MDTFGKIDAENKKAEYGYDLTNRPTQTRNYESGDWHSPVKTVVFYSIIKFLYPIINFQAAFLYFSNAVGSSLSNLFPDMCFVEGRGS